MESFNHKGIYFRAYVYISMSWCDKNSQDENDDVD